MALTGTLTAEECDRIALLCEQAEPAQCLDHQTYGNSVLRLDSQRVVKYGIMVREEEAWNQLLVSQIINPQIVRVPRVHGWFSDEKGCGYLVMDLMDGQRAKRLMESLHGDQIRRIVEHLHSLKSTVVGPLHNGCHQTILFGEGPAPRLSSIEAVTDWFSKRLFDEGTDLSLTHFDLVLCHMDLTCRNLLWASDQPPCLLDWEHAGFYPRFFEKCSQEILGRGCDGNIIGAMPLSAAEQVQFDLVMKAFANEMRFCL